ncbi:MAG: UDP-N-acetylmuramoyl-L-alanyl-D-glutamate--2,6-diaminopimelate ligase [Myxococcota bacterium]
MPNLSLGELLAGAGLSARVRSDATIAVLGLTTDSRAVKPGMLFAALSGTQDDGQKYVKEAVERGASVVLLPAALSLPRGVAQLVSSDVRGMLAKLAASFYGHPSEGMTVIGVTGTNGKTTTTYLLEGLFNSVGMPTGVIGTVNYRFGDKVLPSTHTTPDVITFNRLLRMMRDAGAKVVISEVSSHGLEQRRVEGVQFDAAVFTNLTRDHLDYHQTMDAYFAAKKKLFSDVLGASKKKRRVSVVHTVGEYGLLMVAASKADQVMSVSTTSPDSDIWVTAHRLSLDGIDAQVLTPAGKLRLTSPLLGQHNLENLAVAMGVGLGLGLSGEQVVNGLSAIRAVPGRLEEIPNPLGFKVLVDYAHTDDALERVLATLRPLCSGRIMTLFGCGGDRDKGKRPLMAAAACRYSDLVVITSDNPRTEDPEAILRDISHGIPYEFEPLPYNFRLVAGRKAYRNIVSRREAIDELIRRAQPGDVVLLAGKGHEDYQIIGTQKQHFDDREEATAAIARRMQG